jgi:hypothetical protein
MNFKPSLVKIKTYWRKCVDHFKTGTWRYVPKPRPPVYRFNRDPKQPRLVRVALLLSSVPARLLLMVGRAGGSIYHWVNLGYHERLMELRYDMTTDQIDMEYLRKMPSDEYRRRRDMVSGKSSPSASGS